MSTVTRDELMQAFEGLQGQFASQKRHLADAQERFDFLRTGFAQDVQQHSRLLISGIPEGNPLRLSAQGLVDNLNKNFHVWDDLADQRAVGAAFREGFNDSLLVFVYGKVKSGKSSLGNYVAWGHSEPDATLKGQALVKPEYFSHKRTNVASGDGDKEAERTRQFRVGATEATSSIQGFRLPGFTWVDSPGLHSTNGENGDLARKYVEQADLILYTMSSQAPGRASDMSEVRELLDDERSVMVLLTGSDKTDEDEEDDGTITTEILMKCAKDQQSQIAEVKGNLLKLNPKAAQRTHILPISTRFAELEPSNLQASGLGTLFQTLKEISEGQGVQLKMNTPLNNLRKGIDETSGDLDLIRELSESFRRQISSQQQLVERELGILGQRGTTRMRQYINSQFSGARPADLQAKLRDELNKVLAELTGTAMKHIGDTQNQGLQQAFDTSRLGAIPQYREVTEEREYMSGTQSSTKAKWGAGGALIGGLIGFALGGPAGAAAGASLGSAASAIGNSARAIYDKHHVVIGDNLEEQRQAAYEHYADALPRYLTEQVNAIYEPVRDAMLEYCKVLTAEMQKLHDALDVLQKSTAQ